MAEKQKKLTVEPAIAALMLTAGAFCIAYERGEHTSIDIEKIMNECRSVRILYNHFVYSVFQFDLSDEEYERVFREAGKYMANTAKIVMSMDELRNIQRDEILDVILQGKKDDEDSE